MEKNLEIIEGNVRAKFKDIDTYNFYQLVIKNWMGYRKTYAKPNYYNFMYELLDNLEIFMQDVYKDVISEMSDER